MIAIPHTIVESAELLFLVTVVPGTCAFILWDGLPFLLSAGRFVAPLVVLLHSDVVSTILSLPRAEFTLKLALLDSFCFHVPTSIRTAFVVLAVASTTTVAAPSVCLRVSC